MKTDKVDWTQTNHTIAQQLGKTYSYVYELRKQLGKPPNLVGGRPKISGQQIKSIDWSLTNKAIADNLKVHPITIFRLRKLMDKAACPRGRRW